MSDPAAALPVARYRLEFEVTAPLSLPAFAGSTLRGAWGMALRQAVCITDKPVCDGCPLLASCAYGVVFETRPPRGHPDLLQRFSQVPKPYVIEPPQTGPHDYRPGDRLAYHTVLAGRALGLLPSLLRAHAWAFRRGVGRGDGRAELVRVVHEGVTDTVVLERGETSPRPHAPDLPPAPRLERTVCLQFFTPLRLQTNGRRAARDEHTARKLLMGLVRRIALIAEFHGAGPLDLDFAALARRAEAIRSETDLVWQDGSRYSNRQRRAVHLGGVVGAWRLSGELAPFAPFLHLGQWLHVGKEATFGLGGYRLAD
ncbi:MAG: hypothetical protein KatS3mg126_2421 [Lysobacteraceae bacterium]|nr:MAG: hypothetical protein KatS3mg126_2421 [Xanthomonadaceae bacterium]